MTLRGYRGAVNLRAAVAIAALAVVVLGACADSGSGSDDGWTRLSPEQVDQRLRTEDVHLVNVHVPYEGGIAGTDAFIPYTEIASRAGELPDDSSTVVLYCRSGSMSTEAAQALVDGGLTGFAELEGGFQAWQAAGLPFDDSAPAR
jgi:rhodanese-related sulfurtransferase